MKENPSTATAKPVARKSLSLGTIQWMAILLISSILLVVPLSGVAWATPNQDPARQTVPTRTPTPGPGTPAATRPSTRPTSTATLTSSATATATSPASSATSTAQPTAAPASSATTTAQPTTSPTLSATQTGTATAPTPTAPPDASPTGVQEQATRDQPAPATPTSAPGTPVATTTQTMGQAITPTDDDGATNGTSSTAGGAGDRTSGAFQLSSWPWQSQALVGFLAVLLLAMLMSVLARILSGSVRG